MRIFEQRCNDGCGDHKEAQAGRLHEILRPMHPHNIRRHPHRLELFSWCPHAPVPELEPAVARRRHAQHTDLRVRRVPMPDWIARMAPWAASADAIRGTPLVD